MSAIPMSTDPLLPVTSARERLAASRAQMSHWLEDDARPEGNGTASASGGAGSSRWLNKLRQNPIAAIVLDAIGDRFKSHPLVTSVHLAEAAAETTVAPLVRSHPAATLGASAALGALFVWLKPWRGLLKPALIGGIATQIAAQLITHFARAQAADASAAIRESPRGVRQPTDTARADS